MKPSLTILALLIGIIFGASVQRVFDTLAHQAPVTSQPESSQ